MRPIATASDGYAARARHSVEAAERPPARRLAS